MGWADEVRRSKVRANADTPDDARTAHQFGAEGIGLCRTEHMFFEGDRIVAVREMILPTTSRPAAPALAKLLPMQRGRLHRAVRDHGAACPSRSACSIRRCTSSCRTPRPRSRKSRAR